MSRKIFTAAVASLALAAVASAQTQNANATKTTTTRTTTRTTTTRKPATATPTPGAAGAQEQTTATQDTATHTRTRRAGTAAATEPGAAAVRAAFDTLVRNIERSDVEAVMALYWNSPQLTIFNNNGTVTRGWEQVRSNRASSYPEAKNVKIEPRDVKVQMLGASGAIVTCLWRQSQEFRGTPESSAGRLTVVFRLINNGWKIVHTHSSPEAPDPSRLAPSEQTPPARPAATPPPAR